MIASETGRPLVQHVVDRVAKCRKVSTCVVATDDERIVAALKPFGTVCVMTSVDHQSGTDRIAEVMRGRSEEIVVNVQGDEPEIEPELVDSLIERLETTSDPMATVATKFPAGADPKDPNLVKVVRSEPGHAIYFSRSPIPYPRDNAAVSYLLHLGIYAYRRSFLLEYASWPQTTLEKIEKLEQLRVLERGHRIYLGLTERLSHGIDTPEQYQAFVKRMRSAPAMSY